MTKTWCKDFYSWHGHHKVGWSTVTIPLWQESCHGCHWVGQFCPLWIHDVLPQMPSTKETQHNKVITPRLLSLFSMRRANYHGKSITLRLPPWVWWRGTNLNDKIIKSRILSLLLPTTMMDPLHQDSCCSGLEPGQAAMMDPCGQDSCFVCDQPGQNSMMDPFSGYSYFGYYQPIQATLIYSCGRDSCFWCFKKDSLPQIFIWVIAIDDYAPNFAKSIDFQNIFSIEKFAGSVKTTINAKH